MAAENRAPGIAFKKEEKPASGRRSLGGTREPTGMSALPAQVSFLR